MADPDLGKRLAYWAHQLRCNKSYPWVGTGLIADLEAAAQAHGAQLLTAPAAKPEPAKVEVQHEMQAAEYDL